MTLISIITLSYLPFVVFFMGTYFFHYNDPSPISHAHPQSVSVPTNIEHNLLISRKTCLGVTLLEVEWRLPLGRFDLRLPRLNLRSCIGMLAHKLTQRGFAN